MSGVSLKHNRIQPVKNQQSPGTWPHDPRNKGLADTVLDHIGLPLAVITTDGIFHFTNTAFDHIFGHEQELFDDRLNFILGGEAEKNLLDAISSLDINGQQKDIADINMLGDEGEEIRYSIKAQRLPTENGGNGLILLQFIDTAEQRRTENAQVAANRTKANFLAAMSHELRTPLNAILGFSEIIANGLPGQEVGEPFRSYADDIIGSGRHLLDLIDDLLDYSRVETGQISLSPEWVKLDELLRGVHTLFRQQAIQRDLVMVIECRGELSPIWLDPRAIRQVLINLFSNAFKYTPRGGQIS